MMGVDTGTDAEFSADLVFDLLSSQRRRMVLYYLELADGPVTVKEISEEIASLENDVPVSELSRQQQKRVYVSLYQSHLPKLSEAGVIEYDRDTGMMALANGASRIDAYLVDDARERRPVRWLGAYLLLAVSSALLIGLVAMDISVFSAVSELLAGGLIVLAFAVLGTAQYLHTRRRQSALPDGTLIQRE
jgi:DNA-binding transcriptional ArsR family regulator